MNDVFGMIEDARICLPRQDGGAKGVNRTAGGEERTVKLTPLRSSNRHRVLIACSCGVQRLVMQPEVGSGILPLSITRRHDASHPARIPGQFVPPRLGNGGQYQCAYGGHRPGNRGDSARDGCSDEQPDTNGRRHLRGPAA
jgi:hypothetical protein